ncbi:hypothetical protein SBD_2498 [Streptomyces bottropensis ATCC 25435]|uniref:Uncharacterized protein n=1 Tax=Streptomyces bottropensis ATCC 25435 TaxID=1054862 RepID=M3EG38_9ACTN|nr:hypothetical protein SBD_2498 [Streptomyces bottropensis ATCC 25435]
MASCLTSVGISSGTGADERVLTNYYRAMRRPRRGGFP